jgi:bacillithiol biosynthesis cysteine-adding enzyme BshC
VPVEPSAAAPDSTARPGQLSPVSPLSIDVRQAPWLRPLAGEYAFNFSNVAGLYAGDPASPDAWRSAIARVQQHTQRRSDVARMVEAQQKRRAAPPPAIAAAQTLADSRTVAVVTGQQAGVFGGPLFTLLKAITAIQLARRASEEHGTPTVAVFWVDAEDHDWKEVASCAVLDANYQPATITAPPPDGAGELPVAALEFDARIEDSLAQLASAMAPTDFTEWVLNGLRAAYRPGVQVADAFARWLEALLGPYGLIVFESADPASKALVAEVFTRELAQPGHTAALAAAAGDALAARGHAPQVTPQRDSASLFHLDGGRRPIKYDGDRFVIGEQRFAGAELTAAAAATPERFSPNVLLRPIVQDTLFPTIAYVAGPSELAYLGQLGSIYEHFGVPMPLMYPRAMATLVDSPAARFLSKYDVPIQDLQAQDESALNRLLEAQLPPAVEQSMKDAEEAINRSMERVIGAMPAVDPTLAGAAQTALGKMQHDLKTLHSKMIHAAKKRDDTLRRQFTRTRAQAFPQGQPQERILAGVFFLNRYGPALIERLLAELPLRLGHHWILTI